MQKGNKIIEYNFNSDDLISGKTVQRDKTLITIIAVLSQIVIDIDN